MPASACGDSFGGTWFDIAKNRLWIGNVPALLAKVWKFFFSPINKKVSKNKSRLEHSSLVGIPSPRAALVCHHHKCHLGESGITPLIVGVKAADTIQHGVALLNHVFSRGV